MHNPLHDERQSGDMMVGHSAATVREVFMADTVLLDIDPLLRERIERVAQAHGWGLQAALTHLLEYGLFACESELAGRFDDADARALQSAIAALEGIQDDPGFARIGRGDGSPWNPDENQPDDNQRDDSQPDDNQIDTRPRPGPTATDRAGAR